MTEKLNLDVIEARANAATEGPWEAYTIPGTRKEAGYVAVHRGSWHRCGVFEWDDDHADPEPSDAGSTP